MDPEIQVYKLLGAMPVFLVWLVGGVLCITRSWRCPLVCAVTGAALAIAFTTRVVLPFITTYVFTHFFQEVDNIGYRVVANSITFAIPQAVVWALLLWVIFGAGGCASRGVALREPDVMAGD